MLKENSKNMEILCSINTYNMLTRSITEKDDD